MKVRDIWCPSDTVGFRVWQTWTQRIFNAGPGSCHAASWQLSQIPSQHCASGQVLMTFGHSLNVAHVAWLCESRALGKNPPSLCNVREAPVELDEVEELIGETLAGKR